jgi:hypothetical protein
MRGWQTQSSRGITLSLLPLAHDLAGLYERLDRPDDSLAILEACWQTQNSRSITPCSPNCKGGLINLSGRTDLRSLPSIAQPFQRLR